MAAPARSTADSEPPAVLETIPLGRPRPASTIASILGVALAAFTLLEVNHPRLAPQSQLAIFAMLGLVLCFLYGPGSSARSRVGRWWSGLLAVLTVLCCGFIVVQTEPAFSGWWLGDRALGHRAGSETLLDAAIGVVGLLLVVEATRRTLGLALPILAVLFLVYAYAGAALPDWLFPHRGYPADRIVAQTFLHTQGVFGVALGVMFTYVFLFVLFGVFLQVTGATRFIVGFATRAFSRGPGGPAKVAVLSSGLMGSLSGSAVANTATTGTFTIPLMKSAGFRPQVAAGIEAAASSGGALVPPVMGAGAYMMLEIIDPPVSYLQVIRAALIPAILYYLSLLLIVHFYARRMRQEATAADGAGSAMYGDRPAGHQIAAAAPEWVPRFEGVLFGVALVSLIALLVAGYTPFRAVSLSMLAIAAVSLVNSRTRLTWRKTVDALTMGSRDVVPLICASACVGIVIGVVTLTGIGTRLPAAILAMAGDSVMVALVLIMFSSLLLGMGLPSAISYLLLATLVGPALVPLGVAPLAGHLFIFYFAMMSMVTPPVALAAYAAGSIAGAPIMRTGIVAFRFALVGFTLPYIFVFRPELLMILPPDDSAGLARLSFALIVAAAGITAFAAGIGGMLLTRTSAARRALLFGAAALLLVPGPWVAVAGWSVPVIDVGGLVLFGALVVVDWRADRRIRRADVRRGVSLSERSRQLASKG